MFSHCNCNYKPSSLLNHVNPAEKMFTPLRLLLKFMNLVVCQFCNVNQFMSLFLSGGGVGERLFSGLNRQSRSLKWADHTGWSGWFLLKSRVTHNPWATATFTLTLAFTLTLYGFLILFWNYGKTTCYILGCWYILCQKLLHFALVRMDLCTSTQ